MRFFFSMRSVVYTSIYIYTRWSLVNYQGTRRRDPFFDGNFNFLIVFKNRLKDSKNIALFLSKSSKNPNPHRYHLLQVFSYVFFKNYSVDLKKRWKKNEFLMIFIKNHEKSTFFLVFFISKTQVTWVHNKKKLDIACIFETVFWF